MTAPLILASNTISGEFEVANSLRFDDGSSDYLNITQGSGNRRTWTYSAWIKKASTGVMNTMLSVRTNNFIMRFRDDGEDLQLYEGAGTSFQLRTNRKFRDPSAWYHIVLAVDTTQGTSSDRIKLYVNGVQETSFQTSNYPSQNYDTSFNNSNTLDIGALGSGGYWNGYMAEICFIDGSQLDPTSFGEFDEDTGIWKPIDVSGLTFGTQGFYLDFEDSSALGNDVSGNDNDFTVNNLTSIDQTTDTCTNNYANFLGILKTGSTLSEGNLKAQTGNTGGFGGISSVGVTQGKWYAEFKFVARSTTGEDSIAVIDGSVISRNSYNNDLASSYPQYSNGSYGLRNYLGKSFSTSSGTVSTTDNQHGGWSLNDIIGIGIDADNGRVYFSKNGQWQNGTSWNASTPTTYLTIQSDFGDQIYFFTVGDSSGSNNATWEGNFGNPPYSSNGYSDANGYGNFEYSVPSGYYALNSKNLAEYG